LSPRRSQHCDKFCYCAEDGVSFTVPTMRDSGCLLTWGQSWHIVELSATNITYEKRICKRFDRQLDTNLKDVLKNMA